MTPANASRRANGGEEGFTLIEMLIASLLMLTVTAAVFTLVNPAHGVFRSQPEVADMQQRLRVGVDTLISDLALAGRGPSAGPTAGPLSNYLPAVLPYRIGDAGDDAAEGVFYRPDAISVLYVPSTAHSTIAQPLGVDAQEVEVSAAPNCPPPSFERVCGFAEKARALLADMAGAWNVVAVTGVQAPALQVRHSASLVTAFPRGSLISEVVTRTYYLKRDVSSGSDQLMRYDGAQTDLPVVDNVVRLQFSYFGTPQPPRSPQPAADADRSDDVWPAGENCVFAMVDGKQVPRLPVLAGATDVELPPGILTDGPWCLDAAHPNRFDADLLRVRRIRITLRVQAAASMRGPASVLFTHGGTASGQGLIPDQEIRFDVTPRNLGLGR